eukprot:TRINITY_DN5549_c0_g2_i4.p1 TRINITY_DN5549_c0_g2~~TRINITY_DN5549_c0_g2_i4.p1  ORF type:complete len:590 (-),score=59.64 TRINITY_DN5549_c0_g2_i4:82-1851(-)
MSNFDAPEATDITALQLRRQHAARELDALREACASKEQEVATLDAAIAQRKQDASAVQGPPQPHASDQRGSQDDLHRAQRVVLAAGGGRAAGACAASGLSEEDGGPGAAIAQLAASPVQKRPRVVQIQDVRPDALQVLTVMAQNRLLPKSAWGMCRSMHGKVRPVARLILREPLLPATSRQAFISNTVIHLQLKGRFDADPLLALSLSPPAPSASSTDRFDSLFKDVTAMTLSNMQGTLTRVPSSLQELHLRACNPMDILPMLRTALRVTDSGPQSDVLTLVKVLLVKRSVAELPDSIGDLSGLIKLALAGCTRLTRLPSSMGRLTALTALELSRCGQLTALPDSVGQLSALTYLDLSYCTRLTSLPDSVGDLAALTELVTNRSGLHTLPDSIGNLVSLAKLDVSSCGNLSRLPDSIGALSALTALDLSSNEELTGLPDSFANLAALTNLDLSYCTTLTSLPESIGRLSALTQLALIRCIRLPDSVGDLQAVTSLDLHGCARLTTLPDSIGNLKGLLCLELGLCTGLSQLPYSIGNLAALINLILADCSRLVSLPATLGQLPLLKRIQVDGCCKLVVDSAAALLSMKSA